MSETAEDKTKRKYITALKQYEPTYQMSIVLDPSTNSDFDKLVLTNNLANIKKRVARIVDCPVIFWLQNYHSSKNTVLPVVVMLFKKTPERELVCSAIESILQNCLSMKIINRRYDKRRRNKRIGTLKKQKLNDLLKGFGKSNLRRFAVLNKSK